MPLPEILLLAWALSMDAFAVALATGIRMCSVSGLQNARMSLSFGFFQFLMPVLGWGLGIHVREYIEAWDHWLAFGLLAFIGLKMIREAFGKEEEDSTFDPTRGSSLLILSIATSIDALAVGLSIALLGQSIWTPALCIGVVCALITYMGLRLGCIASGTARLGPRAAILGGLVLIGIGVRILFEHGVFS